jgi:DNA-binding transcriptional ArsR family regulator
LANQNLFQALADPTRREILERLRFGPLPVSKLGIGLAMSRPAVSQHLRVLRDAGLASENREGTYRFYRIESIGFLRLRDYIQRFCEEGVRMPERTKHFMETSGRDASDENPVTG